MTPPRLIPVVGGLVILRLLLAPLVAPAAAPAGATISTDGTAPRRSSAAPFAGFSARTKGAERRTGLLATALDRKGGRLWLELPPPAGARNSCGTFLLIEGIRTGLGSNPVGLDRGQLGDTRVVAFRRVGGRVVLEERNLRYRADSPDAAEQRAVEESFASSILWAGEIAGEAPDGRLLVDFTSAVVRDAHGVVAALKSAGQGSFALDRERSVLEPENCRSFPDNLEFEALLTFASDDPGPEVRSTAPTPGSVTIVQHQSLVRLPDDGYRPRAFDPRSGSFEILHADYARPIAAELDVRRLVRHRLEKLDPAASPSRVRKPIVYYVDSGAPEPIRSALVEGASWWRRAFEAAGFIDAFEVRVLPPDIDPLDVRYNVIQWVHRATRGWSYGGGVIDPRTGEMIKGHVTLGSLRIRQDRMIFEGLLGAAKSGSGLPDDPVELSLARIRQLAAHEVGHTLGLAHNFAASTYAGRGSVMDYPAPLVTIRPDSTFDVSGAYTRSIGAWDVQAVRYAYTEFPSADAEAAGLAAILRENRENGYLYLSDADTRPSGAAHPLAAMWDNGADPVAELDRTRAVRRLALRRFGEECLPPGAALGTLGATLMPLYFHHRYQLEAAARSIGGLEYAYAVRGDASPPIRPVAPERQRTALAAVLALLDPAELDLPESLLERLPPPSVDEPSHREFLVGRTAPAFDPLGAAASAADLAIAALLPEERLARLVDFHRRDPAQPGVDELLEALTQRVFAAGAGESPRLRAIRRSVQAVTVRRLLLSAARPGQAPDVRAALERALERLGASLASTRSADPADQSMAALLSGDIRRYLERPAAAAAEPAAAPGAPPEPPPGPPIGMWDDDSCGRPGGSPRR